MTPSPDALEQHPADEEVGMLHYLCKTCGMSATIVVTETGCQAWNDHMATHMDPLAFETWGWTVKKLF